MYLSYHKSPAGLLRISASDIGISEISFINEGPRFVEENAESTHLKECILQLDEYFSGKRKTFSVSLDTDGTSFQKEVWAELQKIPFGKTMSYLDLAIKLGDPNKIRAVGMANGKNPIAIIVPCHRVIGSNGSLTGYAGGLDKKRWLLHFEGSIGRDLFDL